MSGNFAAGRGWRLALRGLARIRCRRRRATGRCGAGGRRSWTLGRLFGGVAAAGRAGALAGRRRFRLCRRRGFRRWCRLAATRARRGRFAFARAARFVGRACGTLGPVSPLAFGACRRFAWFSRIRRLGFRRALALAPVGGRSGRCCFGRLGAWGWFLGRGLCPRFRPRFFGRRRFAGRAALLRFAFRRCWLFRLPARAFRLAGSFACIRPLGGGRWTAFRQWFGRFGLRKTKRLLAARDGRRQSGERCRSGKRRGQQKPPRLHEIGHTNTCS
ncbi:hypothetical protein [Aureimonas psammosilenae]|uniref:hypothetical protein n=1 Tax=Aureimonas psammosilenae TaxID=2495496 RepID=UPI001AEDDBCC|nr:hypothetical protein [Aureimonas psammosilenae]